MIMGLSHPHQLMWEPSTHIDINIDCGHPHFDFGFGCLFIFCEQDQGLVSDGPGFNYNRFNVNYGAEL
jgi:hypothetical protein